MSKMKAAVFVERGRIVLQEKPIPDIGPLDALMRVTTTTICGTDVHILKGEYPVRPGLIVGHEPVGVIQKLGSAVTGYREGQRVIAGAITPSGYSAACLCGCLSQDGAGTKHGFQAIGGWKFGNTIDGCQAEYVLVPDAITKKSVKPADGRRSSTTSLTACLLSAAASARSICAGSRVVFFFLAVFVSLFAMQPACRRNPRLVRSPPPRHGRRVKSVMFNMLLHVRRHQPRDRLARGQPLADRSR